MDVDGLPIVGASIDLSKVPPIHQKRTLAFLNHFVSHTVNFLNKFSSVCESKLEEINIRIQRIETSLSILEAKLSSVPGLEVGAETNVINLANETTENHVSVNDATEDTIMDDATEDTSQTAPQDPRYTKYIKLIQMGVPLMALRPKLEADGLDPNFLVTTNKVPAPPTHSFAERNASESASDTASSEFSN